LQGNTPYATITIKGSSLPDNKYYELDITDLVKEFISGKYENTGILIKAKTENDNYIAFYSSNYGEDDKKPVLTIEKNSTLSWVIVVCTSPEDAIEQAEKIRVIVGDREIKKYTEEN
jgi:uncharacterized membrane protein